MWDRKYPTHIEVPEDYWTITTTADTDNPNLYWHNGKND